MSLHCRGSLYLKAPFCVSKYGKVRHEDATNAKHGHKDGVEKQHVEEGDKKKHSAPEAHFLAV